MTTSSTRVAARPQATAHGPGAMVKPGDTCAAHGGRLECGRPPPARIMARGSRSVWSGAFFAADARVHARVCLGFSQSAHSVALKEFSRSASLCEPGKTGRSPMERVRERTRTRRKDGEATTQAQCAACVCVCTYPRPPRSGARVKARCRAGRARGRTSTTRDARTAQLAP